MPLLPKEAEISPDAIFELSEPWRIAHVRSRQEKALARQLHRSGIAFYVPQVERRSVAGSRTRSSFVPLFPGYVFFRCLAQGRQIALRANVVANLIEVEDQELLNQQLGQIRRLQLEGATFQPVDELTEGDPVRITEGAFAGYEGVVVRTGSAARLIVSISLLRRSVVVEFPRERLGRRRS